MMKLSINAFAPHKLAVLVTVLIILFTLIPKSFYEKTLFEKNYMFLNFEAFAYIIFSLSFFILGCFVAYVLTDKKKYEKQNTSPKLTIFIVCNCIVTLIVGLFIFRIANYYDLLFLLSKNLSSSAPFLRLEINRIVTSNSISFVTPVALANLIYMMYVKNYYSKDLNINIIIILWYYLNITLYILSCLLLFNKTPIIALLLSTVIVYVLINSRTYYIKLTSLILYATILITLILGAFVFFQSNRYSGEFSPAESLIGYFPASVNRFAALVDGKLDFPSKGTGIYSLEGFITFPVLSSVLNFPQLLSLLGVNLPADSFENWRKTFDSLSGASLNKNFNWISIYGFTFQDFGWWGFLWFALYGSFAGTTWTRFKGNKIDGIILYPFVIMSFQWWSTALIFNRDSIYVYIFVFIIYIVSKFRLNQRTFMMHNI